MKRFKTIQELREALIKYDSGVSYSMILKNGNDPREWLYVDYHTFEPLFYYMTEEEINRSKSL